MRLSRLIATTLVLAACGAVFVVVPARGTERTDRVDTQLNDGTPTASFTTIETKAGSSGPGSTVGGCKSVATFTSSAVPELQKDGCAGCHAGGSPSATSAFDLTNVGKDNSAACAKALGKVNLASKPESAIIQAAAGSLTHTGGKVADTQPFTTALLGWINNE